MKKIVLALVALLTMTFANDAKVADVREDKSASMMVGGSMTSVYQVKSEDAKYMNGSVLLAMAKKNLCKEKDIKDLIEAGVIVQYVYVTKSKVAVVQVDSCK